MLNKENQEKCNMLLQIYGPWPQMTMTIEECSELIKACCKMFREQQSLDFHPSENLIEELTDVTVMCEQMRIVCGISEAEINLRAERKLKRAIQRATGEEGGQT